MLARGRAQTAPAPPFDGRAQPVRPPFSKDFRSSSACHPWSNTRSLYSRANGTDPGRRCRVTVHEIPADERARKCRWRRVACPPIRRDDRRDHDEDDLGGAGRCPAGPLSRQGVPMAGNTKPSPERAGDRDKALESALLQIERQFGKGSVMRLGEETRVPVEVIPTGSIALDVALGLGGLPRGRIVEVYGPESSGKCLTADTYVWSDRGLETIAELLERAGMKASCTSRVTDVSESGIRLVNEKGELEPVVALTHNNRKPVLRLKLRSGRTVSVTHNHPLRVVSDRGFIVWRKAGEVQVGDTVVSTEFGAVEAAGGDGLSE